MRAPSTCTSRTFTASTSSTSRSSLLRTGIMAEARPPSGQVALVEQELIDCIRRKKEMDRLLLDMEVQLYNYETSFLERYASSGSIVKGFDPPTFLSLLTGTPAHSGTARAGGNGILAGSHIAESDRLFSSSSMTMQKALQLKQKQNYKQRHNSDSVLKSQKSISTKRDPMPANNDQGGYDEDEPRDNEDEPYIESKGSRAASILAQNRKRSSHKKVKRDRQ